MNVLGLVFKVEEISTAVSSLNKQICCTYEKISKKKKKKQATIYFFFFKRVLKDSYQVEF